MTSTPAIGFIGLGLMGTGFTRRLVERGFEVTGFDVVPDKVAAAAAHGVVGAKSPAEVARAADIVLICVTATAGVEAAVFGHGGIAEAASRDKALVDHSTTEIGATKKMAERLLRDTGMEWIDAPVSGGPGAAETGTLAIMAGGADAALARVRDVMAQLGRFTPMGPVGAGQATKMINQVLVLTNYCVIAEAVRLAEKCGLDAARIPEAVAGGHADSNLLKALLPRIVARDFAPRGFARQVMKDLDMVHALAHDVMAPTPMASQALSLFRLLNARGHGELDGSAIARLYLDEPV